MTRAMSLFDAVDLVAPPTDPRPVKTAPWKQYEAVTLYHGDSIELLKAIRPNSVDALVTDPPYGIGFMGKEWDTFTPATVESKDRKMFQVGAGRMRNHENPNVRGRSHSPALSPSQIEYDRTIEGQRGFQAFTTNWGAEVLRVLKPGAHAVVCGAPRSAHRMVCGLEDAGFEIRDSLAWLFGQGFPKSHNLDGGWGTALKPGHEPITLARKPFDGTVERCVEIWGTGAINIDGCRIPTEGAGDRDPRDGHGDEVGRWPANVILDDEAATQLDRQSGYRQAGASPSKKGIGSARVYGIANRAGVVKTRTTLDGGGASRFFFVAKPSRAERDFGCDDLPVRTPGECTERTEGSAGITPYAGAGRSGGGRNFHPTVKPVELMRWLIRLVTPANGVVLDLFLGSGTTGIGAVLEGHPFIGIDREEKYLTLADARISAAAREVSR